MASTDNTQAPTTREDRRIALSHAVNTHGVAGANAEQIVKAAATYADFLAGSSGHLR